MANRTWRWTVLAAFLFALALAPATTAQSSSSHATYFTFSQSVQLPGVALAAGTYIFEVAAPGSDVVRVVSRDRKHSFFQGFTDKAQRSPEAARRGAGVTLGESPAGSAPPINAWFPEGDQSGHAFLYR